MAISFKQVLIDSLLVRESPYNNPISTTAEFLVSLSAEGTGSAFGIDETDLTYESASAAFDLGVRWLEEIHGKTETEAKAQIISWLMGEGEKQIPGFLNCLGNYLGFPPQYEFAERSDEETLYLRAYDGEAFGGDMWFYINLTDVASAEGFEGITTLNSFKALSLSDQWRIIISAFSDSGYLKFDVLPTGASIEEATCGTSIGLLTSNDDQNLFYSIEVPVFFPAGDKYICVLAVPDHIGAYILYNSDYPEGKILIDDLRFDTAGNACNDFTVEVEPTVNGLTLEELASIPRLQKYFNGVTPAPIGLSATKKHFIRVI